MHTRIHACLTCTVPYLYTFNVNLTSVYWQDLRWFSLLVSYGVRRISKENVTEIPHRSQQPFFNGLLQVEVIAGESSACHTMPSARWMFPRDDVATAAAAAAAVYVGTTVTLGALHCITAIDWCFYLPGSYWQFIDKRNCHRGAIYASAYRHNNIYLYIHTHICIIVYIMYNINCVCLCLCRCAGVCMYCRGVCVYVGVCVCVCGLGCGCLCGRAYTT